jgi:hypothetical protein
MHFVTIYRELETDFLVVDRRALFAGITRREMGFGRIVVVNTVNVDELPKPFRKCYDGQRSSCGS